MIDVLCVVIIGVLVGAIVPLIATLIGVLKVVTFFILVDTVGTTITNKKELFSSFTYFYQPMGGNHKPFLIQNNSFHR